MGEQFLFRDPVLDLTIGRAAITPDQRAVVIPGMNGKLNDFTGHLRDPAPKEIGILHPFRIGYAGEPTTAPKACPILTLSRCTTKHRQKCTFDAPPRIARKHRTGSPTRRIKGRKFQR